MCNLTTFYLPTNDGTQAAEDRFPNQQQQHKYLFYLSK